MQGNPSVSRRRWRLGRRVYNPGETSLGLSLGLVGSYVGGGGEQGDSGEDTTHLKPPVRSIIRSGANQGNMMASDGHVKPRTSKENLHVDSKNWVVEVYKGSSKGKDPVEEHEDELMTDIGKEDVVEASRVLGIVVYYSRKSYNPQFLFSDMISAWGIERLTGVEKLGDYMFKVEFTREEEKVRVIEGGPWRHKGDALLIAHYDGLLRPSEIPI
jgi:hypothetical protein